MRSATQWHFETELETKFDWLYKFRPVDWLFHNLLRYAVWKLQSTALGKRLFGNERQVRSEVRSDEKSSRRYVSGRTPMLYVISF